MKKKLHVMTIDSVLLAHETWPLNGYFNRQCNVYYELT